MYLYYYTSKCIFSGPVKLLEQAVHKNWAGVCGRYLQCVYDGDQLECVRALAVAEAGTEKKTGT